MAAILSNLFRNMPDVYLAIVLAPLIGALLTGLLGKQVGRRGSHYIAIIGVGISAILSLLAYYHLFYNGGEIYNAAVYTWMSSGDIVFEVGFLVDQLSVTMMVVVTFVSWMIHIYTIAYMHDDPGYQRFFSYISLFTFAMLMLVMSNNFMQLFFGWEAVGLVSYLLIGFWYKRDTAIVANLKAFIVNRIGDFGFLLGIAAIFMYCNTLDYVEIFQRVPELTDVTVNIWFDQSWSVMSVICICLFIGAMGKSAQMPLHVWLPDSMEGPTPISALIHAATMVTAGIFMVSRMSPLYELSETALNLILIIGASTALFMGLLGLVQNDIKRVIAYSTLSQLGYMTTALGASAYAAAMFHLVTHAFFKALLFLAAGAVIMVMHHQQDMRNMGGLYKYLPITWLTCLAGLLALIGFPGTAGFYSKDAIIEAVHLSSLPASGYAYYAVVAGVFITALYSFRLFFMTFHGQERMDRETWSHLHECSWVVTLPLIVLAIPSLLLGIWLAGPMLFGDYFGNTIQVAANHDVLSEMAVHYHGHWYQVAWQFIAHTFKHPIIIVLAFSGVFIAWLLYAIFPHIPTLLAKALQPFYWILQHKYGFDNFNQRVFAVGSRLIGQSLWRTGDIRLIDGLMVNGSALSVARVASIIRQVQSGYLYHYAFVMILGLLLLLAVFVHQII